MCRRIKSSYGYYLVAIQFAAFLRQKDVIGEWVKADNGGTITVDNPATGAIVGVETRQGKGHVVRRMFGDIDADVYVMIDGDATYDAPSAPGMIAMLVAEKLDMVVGSGWRPSIKPDAEVLGISEDEAHKLGNQSVCNSCRSPSN